MVEDPSRQTTPHGSERKLIGPDQSYRLLPSSYCLHQNVGAKGKYMLCKELHMPQLL